MIGAVGNVIGAVHSWAKEGTSAACFFILAGGGGGGGGGVGGSSGNAWGSGWESGGMIPVSFADGEGGFSMLRKVTVRTVFMHSILDTTYVQCPYIPVLVHSIACIQILPSSL